MEAKDNIIPEFELLPPPGSDAAGMLPQMIARQSSPGYSLSDWVASGRLSIPRRFRDQRPFFRFLRRAGSDSRLIEQIYRFRDTVLLSALTDRERLKGLTVALTGVRGGEGTSFLSLILVLALGECTQKKVAFLDGRFEGNRFTVLFDVLGLSRNSVSLQTGFSEIAGFYNERYPNVYFLHSTLCQRSIQFFSDKRLASFLAELRQHFDFTVIDLPPLLKGPVSLFPLPHLDRLLLVAEVGRTKLSEIERCIEVARQAGRELSGAILNKQRTPWWARFLWKDFFY